MIVAHTGRLGSSRYKKYLNDVRFQCNCKLLFKDYRVKDPLYDSLVFS